LTINTNIQYIESQLIPEFPGFILQ